MSELAAPRGASDSEGFGRSALTKLLEEYFDEIDRAGAPTRRFLRPGLSDEAISATLSEIGLEPPEELLAWYGAFDGITAAFWGEPFMPFPYHSPHALSEAVRLYRQQGSIMGYGSDAWLWNPSWLQIADPVHSISVNCDPRLRVLRVRLVGDDRHTQDTPDAAKYEVESLCTPVSWWIQGIRAGYYYWSPERRIWLIEHSNNPFTKEQIATRLL
jgi:hypothetical protein